MKNKVVLVNFLIFDMYFFLLLYLTWGVSGGDIFLILATGVLTFIHVVVLIITFFKNRLKILKPLVGIMLGLLLALLVFKMLEFQKRKILPNVSTNAHL